VCRVRCYPITSTDACPACPAPLVFLPQLLRCVSRTSLMTKLAPHLAEQLTDIVTDAVLTIRQPEQPLDLYMVRQWQQGAHTPVWTGTWQRAVFVPCRLCLAVHGPVRSRAAGWALRASCNMCLNLLDCVCRCCCPAVCLLLASTRWRSCT
jgi:hypothetical protein